MVKTRVTLEPEVQEIFRIVDAGKNFLLSGGAGSGKTYSLIQVINQTILEHPTAKIACMTYTNSAVREIEARVNSENLIVSTIHDFLWDSIKSFQNEIKKSLVELINDEDEKRIQSPDSPIDHNYFEAKNIRYKEFTLVKEGIISHDELLLLASRVFKSYKKLSDILKDRFKFIFIDEYQDTNELIVDLFLTTLKQSDKVNTIGFFGDAMQSIYDDTVGDLNVYIASNDVYEVKKEQNRRNPRLVYELANTLRTDGIKQTPSKDFSAPNMNNKGVKEGDIKFFYSLDTDKLSKLKAQLDWDFTNPKITKELNLTHNLIAPKAGFEKLMSIYDADKILDYKKRITTYIKDEEVAYDFTGLTFGQVIQVLLEGKNTPAEQRPILPTPGMQAFIDAHTELFEDAKSYPFEEFKKLYLDKESLIDDTKDIQGDNSSTSKRDNLIRHLFKIQTNVNLYSEHKYNEFLRNTEFKIKSTVDKQTLKEIIVELQGMSNNPIEDVIEFADTKGICIKDDKLTEFIASHRYVWNQVKAISFIEFQNLFKYVEGYTPFSTQHKIKGAEFNNVLVVLDNGDWTKYNFEYLLNDQIFNTLTPAKKTTFPGILNRTQKLFYVCCTRAKDNLVVYYHHPSVDVLNKAKIWFGEPNVLLVH